MRIAVYSGSFNPLHVGHLAILRHLVDKEGFDKVYLIVSPKNPLKDNISSCSAAKRFEAARQAVRRHGLEGVTVDDIEMRMPQPNYTVRTLDALKAREPENDFTLIMGADQIADIHRWKDFGRILSEYGVKVYPRKGTDLKKTIEALRKENPSYRIGMIDAPMVDVSSTMIREAVASGKDMEEYLM
ncbi:MAG: nicotinate (nicotinamide) nucleotide adenylyltransferase [Candidatus Cryptobacteroides sp.]